MCVGLGRLLFMMYIHAVIIYYYNKIHNMYNMYNMYIYIYKIYCIIYNVQGLCKLI